MANRKIYRNALWLSCLLLILGGKAWAQTLPADGIDARTDTATLARLLGSADPLQRQRAAEALAQLAALDQKKLVEGYYLQEKNKSVRLALEWALYRIGKDDVFFRIVRDLDSGRHDQAVGYISQVNTPDLLYPFLHREDNKPKITVGLIEALERLGDGQTVEQLEKYRDSLAPGVAAAAEKAIDSIKSRTTESVPRTPSRPRTVVKSEQTSP
jgi:HEAT repeat protein